MTQPALGWFALGVAAYLLNEIARGRGWWAIVAAATGGSRPRRRDVVAAWVAGVGLGRVLTARAGDALRVLLLARHVPRGGCALLTGTLIAEGVGEVAGSVLLLAIALAAGVGVPLGSTGTAMACVGAAVAVAIVGGGALRRRRSAIGSVRCPIEPPRPSWPAIGRRILDGLRRGCALLGSPGAYLRSVAPWQLASRVLRVASLACFLPAFHLPATPRVVLLVIVADGAGRVLPFAPAAAGAGGVLLATTLPAVAGAAVPAQRVAAFVIGTNVALTAIAIALTVIVVGRAARWRALAATVVAVRRRSRVVARVEPTVAAPVVGVPTAAPIPPA